MFTKPRLAWCAALLVLWLAACSNEARTRELETLPDASALKAQPAPPPVEEPRLLDDSCTVAADCQVKDVGNCCGRMPACVNRAVQPDHAGLQAECAKEGRAGICGFQELSGCQCVEERCVGIPAGTGGDVR